MKKNPKVTLWHKHNKNREEIFQALYVRYKRKKWLLTDLLEHLAEVAENPCVPDTGCLFKGQEYMNDKHCKRTSE